MDGFLSMILTQGLSLNETFSVFMGYFSADRVRWIPFFGVPLAYLAMYEDTSSVTAVAFD